MHNPAVATRLVQENMSIVAMFAFGQPRARQALRRKFVGEWKYLEKMVYQIGEERADRALLEMATQLRILDDREQIAGSIQTVFGKVVKEEQEEPLYFRDMTNKIVHAAKFEWDFKDPQAPIIHTYSPDPTRWVRAELEVISLLHLSGQIMF